MPKRWAGRRVEAVLDLGGGEGARPRALVRDAYGAPLQGLGAEHPDPVLVAGRAHGDEDVRLFVEASVAAAAADALPLRVSRADLAVRDEAVWRLSHDIRALHRLQRSLTDDVPRAARIRDALERAMDAVDPRAVGRTASAACAALAPELARAVEPSSRPALVVGESAPAPLGAVPLHEAVRACARDFSTLAALADEYPGFVSVAPACSTTPG
ncbi:hypothetical protein SAZ11_57605 [Streptomyces sp. FXJ1.4098]|nr:hypothetical protein [Streptomyces sp. FXJ1.4098]